MKGKRYQVIEIDGKWFVIDMRWPDSPYEAKNEKDAETTARTWNLFVTATGENK